VQGMVGAGRGGKEAGGQQTFGGGSLASVVDGNKKRYLGDPTDQVRRMPVGISVVVDQSYLQDVLVAFANSPLRFQITQVDWIRFRGSLGTESESGSSAKPSTGSGVKMSGSGQFGDSLMKPSAGSGSARPRPGGPGPGSLPNGTPMGPGTNPNGGYMGGSPGSTVSESQLTSGLIDLRVYGIVSLYFSPEAPPSPTNDPNADPKKDKDPKDKDPKDKDPKDKDPKGKDPKEKEPGDKDPKGKDPMPKTPMPADPKAGTEPKTKM